MEAYADKYAANYPVLNSHDMLVGTTVGGFSHNQKTNVESHQTHLNIRTWGLTRTNSRKK